MATVDSGRILCLLDNAACLSLCSLADSLPLRRRPRPTPTNQRATGRKRAHCLSTGVAVRVTPGSSTWCASSVKSPKIVVITTAGGQKAEGKSHIGSARVFKEVVGEANVSVLHTLSREVADSDEFTAPIDAADAVWMTGGEQARLAETFLGTKTEKSFRALLDRGGVIGGTSAGAQIQSSFMMRGVVRGGRILGDGAHQRGFGFITNTAFDVHVAARGTLTSSTRANGRTVLSRSTTRCRPETGTTSGSVEDYSRQGLKKEVPSTNLHWLSRNFRRAFARSAPRARADSGVTGALIFPTENGHTKTVCAG